MLPDFIVEAVEHLEEMEERLLQLEQDQKNGEILDEIFRSIHSIKGAAQYIGLERISAISHNLESLLDLIRQGEKQLNQNSIDLFIDVKDCIYTLVDELDRGQTEETEIDHLLHRIKKALDEPSVQEQKDNSVVAGKGPEEPARLENETLDEEYDEELLDIFMQQLKENIIFLQAQITELDTSVDKVAMLNRCRDTIKSLYSSANYMGYEMLCGHYTAWQAEIDTAEQGFSSGQEPELDFMQLRFEEIVRVYPHAAPDAGQKQGGEFDDGTEGESLSESLDSLFADFVEEVSAHEEGDVVPAGEESENDSDELLAALSDAFDETTETSGHTEEIPRLENETLDEVYDEELLDIFVQQLKENIGFLQKQIAELDTSVEKVTVLERCRDTIKSLYSSANYMGYDLLREHYIGWQEKIDMAENEFSSDKEETELDFMQMYLDEIIRVYPETATDTAQNQVESPMQEPEDDFVTDSGDDTLDDTLDSLFGDTSPADGDSESIKAEENQAGDENEPVSEVSDTTRTDQELFGKLNDALSTANLDSESFKVEENQAGDENEPVSEVSDTTRTDQELFGKLQDALDISIDEEEDIPVTQMHGVIEEMMSTSDETAVTEQNTIEEEMPQSLLDAPPFDDEEVVTAPHEEVVAAPHEEVVADQQQNLQEMEQPLTQPTKKEPAGAKKVKQSMRVDADKIDFLMNQVGELVVSRAYFAQLFNEVKILQQGLLDKTSLTKSQLKPLNEFSFKLGEAGVSLGRVSNELQEAVMKVRMLPVAQLFKRYPRLVRDLVNKSEKEVNLELKGEETELDKMVIEEISDPLIHIIRNSVDHGIETVSERKQLGKPENGTLTLEAYHESNHIVIEVTDDGRGIDPERIKIKALERRLYTEEELERMTPLELTRLVMVPGFSTAEKTTETSGRGVGMDVVRRNIEKLNGTIDIESEVGQQTKIRIKIPLTLAIIQALMVRVARETFTIPLTAVEETLRIFQHEISEIEGVEVIHLRDTTMPIFRLSKLFRMKKRSKNVDEDKFFVVVVSTGMQEVGLVVDQLLGQEEVVIKPLADYLRVDSGFSGATIIGDGAISLILDIPELIKMTTEQQVSKQRDLAFKRRDIGGSLSRQQAGTIH